MSTDLASIFRTWTPLELIESALNRAFLTLSATAHIDSRRGRDYAPDPWSAEAPFLGSEWPRS